MSQKSPPRSAPPYRSQAIFSSSVRKRVHDVTNAEDILPFRTSQLSQSSVLESDDLHPWVKGNRTSVQLRTKQPSISHIKWTCPPKFILNDDWLVAAGDQSEERRIQELRESGVPGLIYPYPAVSSREDGYFDDDHNIPIIPITPIEDDEENSLHVVSPPSFVKENVKSKVQASHLARHAPKPNGEEHPLGTLTGNEADVRAAASAAFTALTKSNEEGSLIDTELLIDILNDPKMIQLLKVAQPPCNEKATSPSLSNPKQENLDIQSVLDINNLSSLAKKQLTSEKLAMLTPENVIHSPLFVPDMTMLTPEMVVPNPISEQPLPQKLAVLMPMQEDPRSRLTTSRQPQTSFLSAVTLPDSSAEKNRNYYKSLVRQHGFERQEAEEQTLNRAQFGNRLGLRDGMTKPSFQKACHYFNSSKGCRYGLGCPYRHGLSSNHRLSDTPDAKRVKPNRKFSLRL